YTTLFRSRPPAAGTFRKGGPGGPARRGLPPPVFEICRVKPPERAPPVQRPRGPAAAGRRPHPRTAGDRGNHAPFPLGTALRAPPAVPAADPVPVRPRRQALRGPARTAASTSIRTCRCATEPRKKKAPP